jgi:hypothetical protein
MSEPIPFTLKTRCVKCLEESCQWEINSYDATPVGREPWSDVLGGDLLRLTCRRCGWRWTMKTADADVRK